MKETARAAARKMEVEKSSKWERHKRGKVGIHALGPSGCYAFGLSSGSNMDAGVSLPG